MSVDAYPARLLNGLLQTERLANGHRKLLRPLIVEIEGFVVEVPGATTTDYSSIPWYGRFLVRWSKVDIAGVVHDYLYQEVRGSRQHADEIWRLIAISGDHRANTMQAWVGWSALRLGGYPIWLRYKWAKMAQADIAGARPRAPYTVRIQ